MFKINFKDVYLIRYIEEIKACIATFQKYVLEEFLEKNPLVDFFCKTTVGGDMAQQIIEDPLGEIQFSEVKCKEVYNIKYFEQMLQKQSIQDQEKRIIRLLSRIFQHHLKNNKILVAQKQAVEKISKAQQQQHYYIDYFNSTRQRH